MLEDSIVVQALKMFATFFLDFSVQLGLLCKGIDFWFCIFLERFKFLYGSLSLLVFKIDRDTFFKEWLIRIRLDVDLVGKDTVLGIIDFLSDFAVDFRA